MHRYIHLPVCVTYFHVTAPAFALLLLLNNSNVKLEVGKRHYICDTHYKNYVNT